MAESGITVQGFTELQAAMAAAAVSVEDLRAAHAAAAALIASAARGEAPVRTGALAGSVRAVGAPDRAVVQAGSGAVPYAGVNHWGWPGRPNPSRGWRGGSFDGSFFLVNAAQGTEPEWLEFYITELDKITAAIGESTP